jgi:hypothetical protein
MAARSPQVDLLNDIQFRVSLARRNGDASFGSALTRHSAMANSPS